MSENNPIHLFVAHEFAENEDYLRVFEYLESRDRFFYVNCARLEPKPEPAETEALRDALRDQIKRAEVVLCPAGANAESNLMLFQLTVAQAFKLPVIVINSFGGTISTPAALLEAATEVVDWDDRLITEAIRRTARGDDTSTWDVIDFDPDEFS